MRQIISATANFTKKDSINSRSASPLQDVEKDFHIIATGAAVLTDEDPETGMDREVGVIKGEDNVYYTCISATIIDVLPDLIAIIDEEGPTEISIQKRKSKSDRTFLTMNIY